MHPDVESNLTTFQIIWGQPVLSEATKEFHTVLSTMHAY